MRTLAPIRVRRESVQRGHWHWRYTCRLCGRWSLWFRHSNAVIGGLRHLRDAHPWPWSAVDTCNEGER